MRHRKHLSGLAAALGLGLSLFGCADDPATVAADRCNTDFGQARIDACSLLIDGPRQPNDTVAAALINRAAAHEDLHRYKSAIADLDRSIALNPNVVQAYVDRAMAHEHLREYDEALADFDHAIAVEPGHQHTYYDRAQVYDGLRQYDRALADIDQAIKMLPDWPWDYVIRARIHVHMGRHDLAVEDQKKAVELGHGDLSMRNMLGAILAEARQYDRAIAEFDEILKARPKAYYAYVNRAIAYSMLKKRDQAMADFDSAIAIKPDFANTYDARGAARIRLGDGPKALEDFDRLVELAPKDAQAYEDRCSAHVKLDAALDKGLEDCNKALALAPDNWWFHEVRAALYLRMRDYKSALADATTVLLSEPRYAGGFYARGLVKLASGERKSGEADIEAAKAIDPNVVEDYAELGFKP